MIDVFRTTPPFSTISMRLSNAAATTAGTRRREIRLWRDGEGLEQLIPTTPEEDREDEAAMAASMNFMLSTPRRSVFADDK